MGAFQARWLALSGLVLVVPPPTSEEPATVLSWPEAFGVLGIVVLGLWWSYRMTVWVDLRFERWQLIREIYQHYRRHRPRPRGPSVP
jgi:protein-S-isoprenylcysteine O-methyltransferase Ste14